MLSTVRDDTSPQNTRAGTIAPMSPRNAHPGETDIAGACVAPTFLYPCYLMFIHDMPSSSPVLYLCASCFLCGFLHMHVKNGTMCVYCTYNALQFDFVIPSLYLYMPDVQVSSL